MNTNLGYCRIFSIITLVDRITKSLDNESNAVAILLDLKKAFDTVDHRILIFLEKLIMLSLLKFNLKRTV